MSLLTQLSNKIQYLASQQLDDPEAEAYAKQQAAQAEHDEETKKRLEDEKAKTKKQEDAKAKSKEQAQALVDRSQFRPQRASSNIASGIIKGFTGLFLALFILYGGHLAANDTIGYSVPFRIVSFMYGCLLFFIEIPKMLIRRYWYNINPSYYSFLPISTYVPVGDLESFFLRGFCYTEDAASVAAKGAVDTLYKTAFEKTQIKTE